MHFAAWETKGKSTLESAWLLPRSSWGRRTEVCSQELIHTGSWWEPVAGAILLPPGFYMQRSQEPGPGIVEDNSVLEGGILTATPNAQLRFPGRSYYG